ncbi:CcdB family protein [Sphingomonas sp. PB4P5]|uniref:CcdB family protein n=1 Tax=Parasphingomonas puruogangriensis TaxID=3096155 RepID=UPI002FCC4F3F
MAQFDVYTRRGGPGYLLDYQADVLNQLVTRFVVPLLPRSIAPAIIGRLNPIFMIGGDDMVLMPQNAATVLARELDRRVLSLDDQRYVISNAMDFLMGGY